jgi:DNA-binding transcriptional MocR family regulator
MRRHKDKGRLQPFVPLLLETMRTPAWRAMSTGARLLYVVLKSRYGLDRKNNGHIFVSTRVAAKELGSNRSAVLRWYRELEHFGFIEKTAGGCLGTDGKGKAPQWRLTELGYMAEPPTKDFLRWNGTRFRKQNSKIIGPAARPLRAAASCA